MRAEIALGLCGALLVAAAPACAAETAATWTTVWCEGSQLGRICALRVDSKTGEALFLCLPDVRGLLAWQTILEREECDQADLPRFAHVRRFKLTEGELDAAMAQILRLDSSPQVPEATWKETEDCRCGAIVVRWAVHRGEKQTNGELLEWCGRTCIRRRTGEGRASSPLDALMVNPLRRRGLLALPMVPKQRVSPESFASAVAMVRQANATWQCVEGKALSIRTLGGLGAWKGEGFDSKETDVRASAVMCLASTGTEKAVVGLSERLVKEDCARVREIISQALEFQLKEEHHGALALVEKALKKHGDDSVDSAAYAVALLGRRAGVLWFARYFGGESGRVRERTSVLASYAIEFGRTALWDGAEEKKAAVMRWRTILKSAEGLKWSDGKWRLP
jgi:hypothetical protein